MTPKQLRILRFIVAYIREHSMPPTLAEIAEHLGITKVTVLDHVRAMEARGLIRRLRYTQRGIEVLRQPDVPDACPVCGRTA